MNEDKQKQSKIGMIALIFALIALSAGATVISSDFYLNTMNGSVTLLPGSNVTIVDDTENKTITINLIGDGIVSEVFDEIFVNTISKNDTSIDNNIHLNNSLDFEGNSILNNPEIKYINDMLNYTVNGGVLSGLNIIDEGDINITWTSGYIYNGSSMEIVSIPAQTTNITLTDNAINYVKWKKGSDILVVEVTKLTGSDVYIARIDTLIDDIHIISEAEKLNTIISKLRRSLREMFPLVVVDGMVVSEKSGGDAFDVISTSGSYFESHNIIEVPIIDSSITPLNRIGRNEGIWTDILNTTIDATQYDNGTDLIPTIFNKYYKSLFLIGHNEIHWIYPQASYNTIAEAIISPIPIIPTGLSYHPKSVTVVLKGDADAFPLAGGEQWQDVRPILAGTVAATSISDHGSLVGLLDDDHPQYASLTYVNSSDDLKLNKSDINEYALLTYVNTSDNLKINKSNIGEASGGTLLDSRLSTNVPLLDKTNNFLSGGSFFGNFGIGIVNPPGKLTIQQSSDDWNYGIRINNTASDTHWHMLISGGDLAIGEGLGVTGQVSMWLRKTTGNAWFFGDVSALTFTDRTPFYDGDALAEISKISGKNGLINHSTLPYFVSHGNESRDIGAMVSVLTKAIQELNQKNIQLEKKIIELELKCIN